MADLLSQLLFLYVLCIFARIILSYFPLTPGGPMAAVFSVLYRITEPVLGPARRFIPPIGPIDVSPIVVLFALQIIGGAIINSLR
jgi:YggT family protein